MKELLESYNVLFILMAISCLSLLLKMVSSALYHKLLWDSNQMGTTDNKWMKSMMSKFEAYYKLRISVHNVENFVDRYLYHYHFLGLSLQTWENIGYYFSAVLVAVSGMLCLTAGYFQLPGQWFWVTGLVTLVLLCVQGAAELFFDTHKCWKVFRIQVIDYMENTMRARLENEYFNQEATRQYQMEYFEPEQRLTGLEEQKRKAEKENNSIRDGHESAAATVEEKKPVVMPEIREFFNTFLEEMQLDKDISTRQRTLSEQATAEKAQLFEEILEEFM